MKTDVWLDIFPIWGVFVLTIAIVLLSIRLGAWLGKRRKNQPDHETEAYLCTISGATLGFLAFMLAFTFGLVAGRFQARMQFLLDEANAIGTTYLRAGFLLEPHQSQVRKLIREYVDIRVNMVKDDLSGREKIRKAVVLSELLQEQMWSHAVAIANADRTSVMDGLFIASLNNMIDLHNSRITVVRYRVPPVLWNTLYFIAILCMITVGYHNGLSGKSSFKLRVILALIFAVVLVLIVDLDRAGEGRFRVGQRPMIELHNKLSAPASQ